jgi:hypothetical protein
MRALTNAVRSCSRVGAAILLVVALSGCSSLGIGNSARVEKAKEMMAERCKWAGEKIHRVISDVDGILIMKLRPETESFSDQFALTDPYGHDYGGDGYIKMFLKGSYQGPTRTASNAWLFEGYEYVEVDDRKEGKTYRYTGRIEEPWQTDKSYLRGYLRFKLEKLPAASARPRYGVTYDDISTREEREHWIAGSSLRVMDLQTGEIIAERIGYMADFGQGNTSGGRSPWLMAANNSCPAFKAPDAFTDQRFQTKRFVLKVLMPIKREIK